MSADLLSAADLDAYFARIGYTGPRDATLATLHALTAHHAATIPFENLDVLLGRPIRLDPAAIVQKLIHDRRGGYCFEQNQLLGFVLRALGFRVSLIGGRARWKIPREVVPPRTHIFLRVHVDDGEWLTDVGLGGSSLTAALRLDFTSEQSTPHEPRRLIREGDRLFHQLWTGAAWVDVCEFNFDEVHPIDCELGNWWTSASPASRFKTLLAVATARLDGTRCSIRDREFVHRRGETIIERRILATPEELLAVLAETFGLHFPPGTRFGPPGSPWPS